MAELCLDSPGRAMPQLAGASGLRECPPESFYSASPSRGDFPQTSSFRRIAAASRGLLRAAATLAFVASIAIPASAQAAKLVSNFDQADDTSSGVNRAVAQQFTTGSNSGGYTLTNVKFKSEDTEGDSYSVSVCTVLASGFPDETDCTALTAPSGSNAFAAGTHTFTAPNNTTLTKETKYTALITLPDSVTFDSTTSNGEDTGGATGWTIADIYHWKNISNVWGETISGKEIRIEINGNLPPPTVSSVAVTSTPSAASDTYGVGEAIEFTVTFSRAVEVSSGRPHFEFALGNSGSPSVDKDATYQSGSGSTALVFAYTVVAADVDDNGIWVGDQSRTLMLDTGEYIRAVDDQTSATLTHAALSTQSDHKVDGSLMPTNNAPEITTTSPQSVAENTTAVVTLAATDADSSDTLTWSLNGGADAGKFTLTGNALTFTTAPNFENPTDTGTSNGYEVIVRVNDGTANVDLTLTVNVTDVAEKPDKPATPTVGPNSGSTTSLDVDWDKPGLNGGPDITGYNIQYRVGTSGAWTDVTFSGTDTETTITSLTAGTEHQARVQAINGETDSDWSEPGTGSTNTPANAAPVFPAEASTRELTENVAANVNVGAPVRATDGEGDTLTYSFGGTDVGKFNFNAATQQITTKSGQTYDYETDASYTVTVTATDGTTPTTVTVTINMIDLPAVSIAPKSGDRTLLTDASVLFVLSSTPRPSGNLTINFSAEQDHDWFAVLTGSTHYYRPDDEFGEPGFFFRANAPVKSGDLTVTLQPGDGYELGTAEATVEIVAADLLITVRAAAASYSPGEGDGTVTVTLAAETIAGAPQPQIGFSRVNWSTTADTATGGGTDFENGSGTVLFFGGVDFTQQGDRWVSTLDVEVTLVDDTVEEETEQFHVTLTRGTDLHPLVKLANADGTLCKDNAAGVNCGTTVNILDNEPGVTISKTALDILEGGTGAYTVVLRSEPTATVTVTPSRTSGDTDITVSGPSPSPQRSGMIRRR